MFDAKNPTNRLLALWLVLLAATAIFALTADIVWAVWTALIRRPTQETKLPAGAVTA